MVKADSYEIKLSQFEGPFDLLLFFVERDELDIYNIPITKLITDFLDYIHHQDNLNVSLASEFILFVATLMRIKAKMLIPRKELDTEGNEIDPRQELIDKVIEYKNFKEIAIKMAKLESERILALKRGNLEKELNQIGEENAEGTEIQNLTLFKLMKAFEKVLARYNDKNNKPVHIIEKYTYTIEQSKADLLNIISQIKSASFEKIFDNCSNKIEAIFLFLSLLELIQQNYFMIMVGENKNNFIVEYIEPEQRTDN